MTTPCTGTCACETRCRFIWSTGIRREGRVVRTSTVRAHRAELIYCRPHLVISSTELAIATHTQRGASPRPETQKGAEGCPVTPPQLQGHSPDGMRLERGAPAESIQTRGLMGVVEHRPAHHRSMRLRRLVPSTVKAPVGPAAPALALLVHDPAHG